MNIFIPGIPQSRGSKKSFPIKRANGSIGVAVTDNNPKSKQWMQMIALAVYKQMGEGVYSGQITLDVEFVMPRPKSHYRTGKRSNELRDNAPHAHTSKPDRGKLLRAVEDALTGIVYRDDSQVWAGQVKKVYGDNPGVLITVQSH